MLPEVSARHPRLSGGRGPGPPRGQGRTCPGWPCWSWGRWRRWWWSRRRPSSFYPRSDIRWTWAWCWPHSDQRGRQQDPLTSRGPGPDDSWRFSPAQWGSVSTYWHPAVKSVQYFIKKSQILLNITLLDDGIWLTFLHIQFKFLQHFTSLIPPSFWRNWLKAKSVGTNRVNFPARFNINILRVDMPPLKSAPFPSLRVVWCLGSEIILSFFWLWPGLRWRETLLGATLTQMIIIFSVRGDQACARRLQYPPYNMRQVEFVSRLIF